MKDSYHESMRKVVSAEYQEISTSLTSVNASLKNIDDHLKDLNNKTASHGKCISSIEKWISAHDAVQNALKEVAQQKKMSRFERMKNNIAIAGLFVVIIIQIIQML